MRRIAFLLGVTLLLANISRAQDSDPKDLNSSFDISATVKFLGYQMTPDHYDLFDSLQADPHQVHFQVTVSH